ncbi:efflux RND transporter periplasmic adaptor subunit [Candidatus Phycosocius spiralis]|uniref:MexH family multidrug efflux RND transporter periplasmic adaptor subunit n=1 Tax=Candidatus Phycosocius spiralis TaxID=2815099 RepID=A0ABQ4PTH9_9PROT|nr:efflux RND transporter periplasmic adaptor subunit [Candidatus Phycosocius spiralis]GIU66033.1 MexH family multidrug efflux RND transporter periplasmic adaptor subunit [Candidatus Phycosocius spiralis]
MVLATQIVFLTKAILGVNFLSVFLKRHFFLATAGFIFAAMFGLVLIKEITHFFQSNQSTVSFAATGPGQGSGAKSSGRPANVVVSKADLRIFSDRVYIPGTALANESITVTSKVQDVVDKVYFESGQFVTKGEVLIRLARTEQSADLGGARNEVAAAFQDADAAYNEINMFSRDLEAARAGIAEAEAIRNEAQLNLDRVRSLAERGFASKARLDSAQTQLQAAQSQLWVAKERAEGALDRIKTQKRRADALSKRAQSVSNRSTSMESRLEDRTIRAPFSGRIGLRTISPGQLARPGEVLATLDDISQIKVDFDVPETRLGALQVGTQIAIRSTALPNQLYRATVRFVDTRIDPHTRTIRARAYIPNPEGNLRPGMLMSVDVMAPVRNRPAVPEVALVEDGNASFVFIAVSDGKGGQKAMRVPVSIGTRRDGFAEIINGLAPGTLVITEGLVGLRDGQPIKPMNTKLGRESNNKSSQHANPQSRGG